MTGEDVDPYRTAEALAPFLAEHYDATGQDLVDVVAADPKIHDLAAAYLLLPPVAEQATEAAAQAPSSAQNQALCQRVNDLMNETAEAIRHRLRVLAARSPQYRDGL